MLQGFSHFRCQEQKGLLFHTLHGPNPLIPAVLQSAKDWQEPEEDIGRVLTSAMRQRKFSFIALAGQPDKFTSVLMAGFRARKEKVFLMLVQKILPVYCLPLLNCMLTSCEHRRMMPGFSGDISHCPAISTGQITYWPS